VTSFPLHADGPDDDDDDDGVTWPLPVGAVVVVAVVLAVLVLAIEQVVLLLLLPRLVRLPRSFVGLDAGLARGVMRGHACCCSRSSLRTTQQPSRVIFNQLLTVQPNPNPQP